MIQLLKKSQQIITAHMDELIKIPNCVNEKPHSLRAVYDQITVHIRGLSAMGVNSDQYGSLLIPMIMSKLPSEIRLRVARESTEELWKIEDLMDVIKKEVEAREASEGTKIKSPQAGTRPGHNLPTANALVTHGHNIQCVYCNGQHYSASCDKVCDIKLRKDVLIKTGRCFIARAPKPAETVIENTINPYVMSCPAHPDLLCRISRKMIPAILLTPLRRRRNLKKKGRLFYCKPHKLLQVTL